MTRRPRRTELPWREGSQCGGHIVEHGNGPAREHVSEDLLLAGGDRPDAGATGLVVRCAQWQHNAAVLQESACSAKPCFAVHEASVLRVRVEGRLSRVAGPQLLDAAVERDFPGSGVKGRGIEQYTVGVEDDAPCAGRDTDPVPVPVCSEGDTGEVGTGGSLRGMECDLQGSRVRRPGEHVVRLLHLPQFEPVRDQLG